MRTKPSLDAWARTRIQQPTSERHNIVAEDEDLLGAVCNEAGGVGEEEDDEDDAGVVGEDEDDAGVLDEDAAGVVGEDEDALGFVMMDEDEDLVGAAGEDETILALRARTRTLSSSQARTKTSSVIVGEDGDLVGRHGRGPRTRTSLDVVGEGVVAGAYNN